MADALLLPLDNRPCTSRFPVELAAMAGFHVQIPPIPLLGDVNRPASAKALQDWLESCVADTSLLVLSLDTWLYGGLVFSRKSTLALSVLQERLHWLQQLKTRYPALRIAVFATLLRLSNHNDATEERPYWAEYGTALHRLAWLDHALQEADDVLLRQEWSVVRTRIPEAVIQDYRSLRTRNFQLLLLTLEQVASGIFESLYIGCDDSGRYGWNVQEKQQLALRIQQQQLQTRVLLYPGADEVAAVLLLKALQPEPVKLRVLYTFPEQAGMRTLYEGISLQETLAFQARAAGIELVTQAEAATALLWIHNSPGPQIDQYLDRKSRQLVHSGDYLRLGKMLQETALPFGLADVCYANGGDQGLLEYLNETGLCSRLSAYAAWNTTGNTLGCIMAWMKALQTSGNFVPRLRFLLERLLDDGWYQGVLRQRLCEHYSQPVTLDACLRYLAFAKQQLKQWQSWIVRQHPGWQAEIKTLRFPWRRFFEIELSVCLKNSADTPDPSHCPPSSG